MEEISQRQRIINQLISDYDVPRRAAMRAVDKAIAKGIVFTDVEKASEHIYETTGYWLGR